MPLMLYLLMKVRVRLCLHMNSITLARESYFINQYYYFDVTAFHTSLSNPMNIGSFDRRLSGTDSGVSIFFLFLSTKK